MEELESLIKGYLHNKELLDIEFFNANKNYYIPDPDKLWIIDSGVELTLPDQKFSFGWAMDKEFFNVIPGGIDGLTGELKVEQLGARNVEGLNALIGSRIHKVDLKWNFYHELDENFEIKEEKKFMPFEIIMTFDNSSTLQLAAVDFGLRDGQLVNLTYESQGNLMISLNEIIEIAMPSDEEEQETF